MSDCQVSLYCPPMKIHPAPDQGLLCHRTDAEPMVCTVKLPGEYTLGGKDFTGQVIINPVTIPPTMTRPDPDLPMVWWVDACVGEGSDAPASLRCLVTGNPCGTDTWSVPGQCKCKACQRWIASNRVRVELPRERVAFHFKWDRQPSKEPRVIRTMGQWAWELQLPTGVLYGLYAEAIDAPTTLWLADGRIYKGSVRFPDCKVNNPLFSPVAEAVTAEGSLVLQ